MAKTDQESTRIPNLLRRLARLDQELRETHDGRAAAEQKLTWALMTFALLARLDGARTVPDVFRALGEVLAALLSGCAQAVYLLEPEGTHLRLAHASLGDRFDPPRVTLLGDGVAGRAAAEQRTVHGDGGDAALAVPFGTPPSAVGALVVWQPAGAPALAPDTVRLVELLGRHAGNRVRALAMDEVGP